MRTWTLHSGRHHVWHVTGRPFVGVSHHRLAVRMHWWPVWNTVLVIQIGRWRICTLSRHRLVVFSRVWVTTGASSKVGPRGRRVVRGCCRVKLAGRRVVARRIHRRRNLFVVVVLRVGLARVNGVSSVGTHHVRGRVAPWRPSCSCSILVRQIGAWWPTLGVCRPIIVRILAIIGVGRHRTCCIGVVIIVGCRTRIKVRVVIFVMVLSVTLAWASIFDHRCLCIIQPVFGSS